MRALLWKELREWGVPIGLLALLASLCWSLADWNDVFLGADEAPGFTLFLLGCPLVALLGWWQHRLELLRGVLPYLVHRSGGFARLFLAKCAVGFGGTLLLAWLPLVIAYSVKALTTPYGPIMQELRLLEYFWTSFGFATAYAAGVFVAQIRRGVVIESLLALLGGLGGLLVAVVVPPPVLHVRLWTMPLYAALHTALGAGILWHAYRMFSRSVERETGPQSALGGAAPVLVLVLWVLPGAALLGEFWSDARNKLLSGYPTVVWEDSEQRYFAIDDKYPQPYHELDESRRQLREIERDPSRIRYAAAYRFGDGREVDSSEPPDPFANEEEAISKWNGYWRCPTSDPHLLQLAGVDPKLGRAFLWRLWSDSRPNVDFRSATRTEEVLLERPDGKRFSPQSGIRVAEAKGGDLLLLDRADASLWRLHPGEPGGTNPALARLSLPNGDALVGLERLYEYRAELGRAGPFRAGVLIIGTRATYEFSETGIVAWIPDGSRKRASELASVSRRQSRTEQTGSFAWRFEATDPKGGRFSFAVEPLTGSERLRATLLSATQLLRPPLRPLTDISTGFEVPSGWSQRLEVFRSLFGPALPRGAQVLHLIASLLGSALAVWMLRGRGESVRAQFAWAVAVLIGGLLTLAFLKVLAAPRARSNPLAVDRGAIAWPSTAGGVS